MKYFKYALIAFGALLLLCALVSALIMVVFDEEDYRRALSWAIGLTTGYDVTVRGKMSLDVSMNPLLSLSDVLIEGDRDDGVHVTGEIGQLRLRVSVPLLLRRVVLARELELYDFDLALSGTPARGTERARQPFSRHLRIPLIENARVRNARISYSDEGSKPMVVCVLSSLVVDGSKHAAYQEITAEGAVNGAGFSLQGHMGALEEALRGAAPLSLDLSLDLAELSIRISGSVRDPLRGKGLDLRLAAEEAEIAYLPRILGLRLPSLGSLRMAATVTGTIAAPSVQDLDIEISGSPALHFAATGSLGNISNGEGADLVFSAATSVDVIIASLLPERFHGVTDLSLQGTLRESHGDFHLENLKVSFSESARAEISGEGDIMLGSWPDLEVKTASVDVKLTASNTEVLKPFLFSWFPYAGPVTAEAHLTASENLLAVEDMQVWIGQSRQTRIVGKGRLGAITTGRHPSVSEIDLSISVEAKDARTLFNRAGIDIPAFGRVSAVGRMRGSGKHLEFRDIKIQTLNEMGVATDLTGMARMEGRETSVPLWHLNLDITVEAPHLEAFQGLLTARALPTLGPVQIRARLTGTHESFMVKEIEAKAGHPDSLLFEAHGESGAIELSKPHPFSNVKMWGSMHATSLSDLSEHVGISLPAISPLEGSWRLIVREDGYGLDDLKLTMGRPGHTLVNSEGRIGRAMRGADVALEEVELAFTIKQLEASALEGIWGPGIAALGRIDGHFSVSGSQRDFALRNVDLRSVAKDGVNIKIRGGVKHVRWEKDRPVQGIHMDIIAKALDMKAVRDLTGLDLPDLGLLDAEVLLRDVDGALNISRLNIRAGTADRNTLRIEGKAEDVTGRVSTALKFEFETRTQPWIEALRHRPVEADYPVRGNLNMKGSFKDLQVEALKIAFDNGDLAQITVGGYVKQSKGERRLNLNIVAEVADTVALGNAFGLEIPSAGPVKIEGQITGKAKQVSFEGSVLAGSSRIDTSLVRQTEKHLPAVSVHIASPKLILADVGMSFRKIPAEEKKTERKEGRIFGEKKLPLEVLKKLELLVKLDIGELVDTDLVLRDVDVDLTLSDGILRLRRTGFTYADGYVSIESTVDAAKSPPGISLHVEAEDVDSASLLSHLRWPPLIRGHLNMSADLQSWGDSPRSLAESLNGRIGLSIEGGEIKRLADLAAADALDLAIAVGETGEYKPLNCLALVFDFQDGIGKSSVIYIDSPSVRSRGVGTLDLREESIDLVLQPKSKTRLINISSAVNIKGPLDKPAITKLPFVEAAQIYGEIFMPYVFLPVRALGYLWYIMKNDKDESSPCLTPSQLDDVDVR